MNGLDQIHVAQAEKQTAEQDGHPFIIPFHAFAKRLAEKHFFTDRRQDANK